MKRQSRPVLSDMLDAIEGIERATATLSFEQFERDWTVRHAVQRGIEIISEAARQLPDELTERHSEIPWSAIKGVGNVLRHAYHKVSDKIIWDTVQKDLRPLKLAVREMLKREG